MSWIIINGVEILKTEYATIRPKRKYGLAFKGSGNVVYDKMQIEGGDYKNVAHLKSETHDGDIKNGETIVLQLYELKNNYFIHRFVKKNYPNSRIIIKNP
jgi:hypothetical protein